MVMPQKSENVLQDVLVHPYKGPKIQEIPNHPALTQPYEEGPSDYEGI